jgi:hypothetical protein
MGVQKHCEKRITKNGIENILQKNRPKNPKPIFSRFLFITFLGVSRQKISKPNLTNPGTFLASEEPTNHVGARHFFLSAPCSCGGIKSLKLRASPTKATMATPFAQN